MRKVLHDQHGDAVGFLAGGAGGAPEAQAARMAAGLDELGQQFGAQQFKGPAVAKETGLVDGHRLGDGRAREPGFLFSLQVLHQLFQVGHALVAQKLGEPRLEEIIARGIEHILREPEDELAKIAVVDVLGVGFHG